MPLAIQEFPEHPVDRRHCFVWTRAKDGVVIRFGCDTAENCEKMLPHFQARADAADQNGKDEM